MASIPSRIAKLEQSSKVTVRRPFTDAELAVRLVNILNNPARSAEHAPLREFLKQAMNRVPRPFPDGRSVK